MRRRTLLAPALAALLAAGAADAAAAANVDVQAVDGTGADNSWAPANVSVTVGDTVTWKFDGTNLPHNVASSSANWTLKSPLGLRPAPASFTFTAAGTYAFICEVHPEMVGSVAVSAPGGTAPPPPPPPPSGPIGFPNPEDAPLELEDGVDSRSPRLSRVRVRAAGDNARVRVRTNERARVTVRFKRAGRTVKSRTVSVLGTRRFTVRNLRRGTYRVEIRARDIVGNRSRLERARVTIH